MPDWYSDNEGQIGVALGAIAIVVALLIAWFQRRPKVLAWDLRADRYLFRRASYIPQQLSLRFAERELTSPRFLVVRVENVGRRAILPKDFLRPVTMSVGNSVIVYADLIDSSPSLLLEDGAAVGSIDADDHGFQFEIPSLNPGEWIEVQYIVDGDDDAVLNARIVEQSKPFGQQTLPRSVRRAEIFGIVWSVLGLGIGGALIFGGVQADRTLYYVVGGIVLYFAIGGFIAPRQMKQMMNSDARQPTKKRSKRFARLRRSTGSTGDTGDTGHKGDPAD